MSKANSSAVLEHTCGNNIKRNTIYTLHQKLGNNKIKMKSASRDFDTSSSTADSISAPEPRYDKLNYLKYRQANPGFFKENEKSTFGRFLGADAKTFSTIFEIAREYILHIVCIHICENLKQATVQTVFTTSTIEYSRWKEKEVHRFSGVYSWTGLWPLHVSTYCFAVSSWCWNAFDVQWSVRH